MHAYISIVVVYLHTFVHAYATISYKQQFREDLKSAKRHGDNSIGERRNVKCNKNV